MSSGCGDVLTLEDLKTAKKHQLFEAEVITGKQGGLASGVDIDYATNPITGQSQKTLPAVLRDAGFRPAPFTFESGGALSTDDADRVVLWPISAGGDGNYYTWKGSLPKVIPAGSTPENTGGVSDSAWRPVTDVKIRDEVASMQADILGGNIHPAAIGDKAQVGDSVPAGTSYLNTDYGIMRMKPESYGTITAIDSSSAIVGGESVYLERIAENQGTRLSNWAAPGSDVSLLLNVLINYYTPVYVDIDVNLSSNVISSLDYRRLLGSGGKLTLTGSSFDTTKGAIELTGNHTEVSNIHFTTSSTSVTPLRMGNTSYGSGDSSRRVGVKSHGCTFEGTGFKGPNHGNFVVIGAIYPHITFPRFIGASKAGGNMEILGVKGGCVYKGYAENGLLVNFHGTSADGVGFPTTDFEFVECEGILNSAELGDVDGAVGGNNNLKFSRGCSNCKVKGGKFTSYANGAYTGADHNLAIQGCSSIIFENVQNVMQNNGDYKSAYGFFDHSASLTDCLDNAIIGGSVTINTPGLYNRICNLRSDSGRAVRRNKLDNVTFNCYNGTNSVDAVLEQYSSTSGLVSDQQVTNCTGLGVTTVLRNRGGLSSTAVTYIGFNRIGTTYDTYAVDSGVVKLISSPCVVNINSSGALTSAVGCSAIKSGVGVWVVTFPTDMSKAGFSFSSPGTGRYASVNKTSTTSWTFVTYNNSGTPADLECSIIIQ